MKAVQDELSETEVKMFDIVDAAGDEEFSGAGRGVHVGGGRIQRCGDQNQRGPRHEQVLQHHQQSKGTQSEHLKQ